MSKAFDDLMRQLGIPTPWVRFCATWGLIGTCEAVKHNLLTCEQLARVVASKPGIPLKDAISEIRHHYRSTSSARTSLAHWVQRGKVPGVRLEPGHPPRLHPADLNRKA